jgi:hypothetical protein
MSDWMCERKVLLSIVVLGGKAGRYGARTGGGNEGDVERTDSRTVYEAGYCWERGEDVS